MLASLAHVPSSRHALDPHSLCAWHLRHASSTPQTGVAPVHAFALLVVHSTHAIVAVLHAAVGAAHCSSDMQGGAPSTSTPGQSSAWFRQYVLECSQPLESSAATNTTREARWFIQTLLI
jgi:hypothetical protein